MVLAVCFILLMISVVLSRCLYKRFFNPALVFFGLWSVVFLLYELDQVFWDFFRPINEAAELLFVLSFVFFFLGCVMGAVPARVPIAKQTTRIKDADLRFLYHVVLVLMPLFVASIVWKYLILVRRYGNPFANLYQIRWDYVRGLLTPPLHLDFISTFTAYLIMLDLGILVVLHRNRKFKIWIVFVFLMVFLTDASVGGRGWSFNLFLFLVSVVFLTYNAALGNSVKAKHPLIIATSAVLFACMINVIYYLRARDPISFGRGLTVDTFQYIVADISSTGYFVEHPFPTGPFGLHTFGGLLQLANDLAGLFGKGFLEPQNTELYYADISSVLLVNTSTHLAYYYADFGTPGVIIISYVLGFISSFLFLKASCKRRIVDVQLAAIVFATLLFSIRGIHSEGRFFWILIVAVVLQHYLLSHKGKATLAGSRC